MEVERRKPPLDDCGNENDRVSRRKSGLFLFYLVERKNMNLLLNLFFSFAKIGMFTFGGGYAMIAMIEEACVDKKKWITHEEMMNITVIAESTPGPIAINCATYVGYKQAGFVGSIFSTLGIVFPSFIIIYIISMFLDGFLDVVWVANAFQGIKIAVGILILDAAFMMLKKMHKRPWPRAVMGCAFVAMTIINVLSLKISSITLMLTAAFVSLTVFIAKGGAKK